MDQHVTLKEAVKLTGKSESTLKRMLREIVHDPAHADRSFIIPPHEEVERRRQAGEPYVWKIDRELLERRFPGEKPPEEGSGSAEPPASDRSSGPVIEILREQLQSKDRQIATLETQLDRKDEQIHNLTERMRETNILMGELQKRLALTGPVNKDAADVMDSSPAKSQSAGESRPRSRSTKKSKSKSIWTKPLFAGLFGKR